MINEDSNNTLISKPSNKIVLAIQDEKCLLIKALILSLFYYLMFFQKIRGLNYFVFFFVFTIFIWKFFNIKNNFLNRIVSASIIILSFSVFFRDNTFLNPLNMLLVPLLISTLLLLNSSKGFDIEKPLTYFNIVKSIFYPLSFVFRPIGVLSKMVKNLFKDTNFSDAKYSNIKKILLGILISVPFISIILSLLMSADMVFNDILSSIPQFLLNIDFPKLPYDISYIIIGFLYFYCLIFYFKFFDNPKSKNKDFDIEIDSLILSTVLTMINLVYILFCFVQFKYLFFGSSTTLPSGIGYANYARSGFFELIFLTVVNISISIFTLRLIPRANLNKFLRILLYLVNFSNFVMIYSAFFRMKLYEGMYGHTRLRFFVFVFLAYEVIVLVFNIIYIMKENFEVLKNTIALGLVIYMGLNLVNIDSLIFDINYYKYQNNEKFDFYYNLNELSFDSFSNIEVLLSDKHPSVQIQTLEKIASSYDYFKNLDPIDDFREFNFSKYKAAKKTYELINNPDIKDMFKKYSISMP